MTFSLTKWAKNSKVVPNDSSSLDSRKYGNDTIHANHMNMCRFNAKDDDGYEKFRGALAKFIEEIRSEQHNRRAGQSSS